jgi:hypothetical protein
MRLNVACYSVVYFAYILHPTHDRVSKQQRTQLVLLSISMHSYHYLFTCKTMPTNAQRKSTRKIPPKKNTLPRNCLRLKKNTIVRRGPIVSVMPDRKSTSPIARSPASKNSTTPSSRKMNPKASKPVPSFLLSSNGIELRRT